MDPLLKYYTVQELHNWLVHNQFVEGLSDKIISPQRAWAIIHNPHVKDTDAVLCAIFENNIPVAYTAAFPEWLECEQRLIWWFSTLYCQPNLQGKGYGLIVIGQLCELFGAENCFDMDGAEETVSIFNFLGLSTKYITRHHFTYKSITCSSIRGIIASFVEKGGKLRCMINRVKLLKNIESNDYRVRYISHIDDVTYSFIASNAHNDAFLRSQQTLNWIISYPFMHQSPLLNRVKKSLEFSSDVQCYHMQIVQIWKKDALVGVFVYRIMNEQFALKYLYYDMKFMNDVFEAITEHFIVHDAKSLQTTCQYYAQWLKPYMLTTKYIEEKQSFSYPSWFFNHSKNIQLGDGDVFV